MADAMELCVSCKACKSECPMSIDMAKMKTEVQAARVAKNGLKLRYRMIASLPRLAPVAAKLGPIANAARPFAGLAGFAKTRDLPKFHTPFKGDVDGDVLLFADTFNCHFDPETLHAARRVIERSGRSVGVLSAKGRALCCGRTYLSAGLTDKAKAELTRTIDAFRTALEAGKTIVGLEPSCTLMFRDEAVNLIPVWTAEMGAQVLTFAEYMAQHPPEELQLQDTKVLVHGHCHQKAMGVAQATVDVLNAIDGADAQMIDSSCCGMAGPFGYQAETEDISRQMAELSLAPAVRAAPANTLIVADGFSCRCQIKDVASREAVSLAVILDQAMTQ
jgi:Fe-S oxidoreductase